MEKGEGQPGGGCNIQVVTRVRPLSPAEEARGAVPVVSVDTERRQVKVQYGGSGGAKRAEKRYTYDRVLGRLSTQEDMYSTIAPSVAEALAGYSVTVFAYGPTGSGKTFTMIGGDLTQPEERGLIPRCVEAMFTKLEAMHADFNCRVSFIELFNEELTDLIAQSAGPRKGPQQKLRLADSATGVQVLGLEEVVCQSHADIIKILRKGVEQRQTAETLLNKQSSRSHTIFTIKMAIKECTPDGEDVIRNGQLNLVDLAGSECVGKSGATNARAREAGNINTSLTALGRCITALCEGSAHIPYRDSKLTRLLQESLGGRSKTSIIATVPPCADQLDQVISTLDYALKARSILNKPEVNQKMTSRTLMKEMGSEIESLRAMLIATREKNGIFLPPAEFDRMQTVIASNVETIKELEAELTDHRTSRKELQAELDNTSQLLAKTNDSLTECENSRAQLAEVLKLTQAELAATQAVVREQRLTEATLTDQGKLLKRSLSDAKHDVTGLLDKVERCCTRIDEGCRRAETLGATCAADFNSNLMALAELQNLERAGSASLTQLIDGMARAEGERCDQLVDSVRKEVDVMACEGSTAAKRVGSELCERLSRDVLASMSSEVGLQAAAIQACITNFQSLLTEGQQGILTALNDTAASVRTTLSAVISHIKQADEMIGRMTSDHRQRILGACELVTQHQTMTHEAQKASRDLLEGFLQQQQADVLRITSSIQESVASQLRQLVTSSETATQDFLIKAKSRGESEAEQAAHRSTEVTSQLMQSLSSLESESASASSSYLVVATDTAEKSQASLDTDLLPCQRQVDDIGVSCAHMVQEVSSTISESKARLQAAAETGEAALGSMSSEMSALGTLLREKGRAVEATVQEAGTTSTEKWAAFETSFRETTSNELSVPIASAIRNLTVTTEKVQHAVSEFVGTASQPLPPTQLTPKKRVYEEVEGPLAATRDHQEIMVEERARSLAATEVILKAADVDTLQSDSTTEVTTLSETACTSESQDAKRARKTRIPRGPGAPLSVVSDVALNRA